MTEIIFLKNPYIREIQANVINKEFSDEKYLITLDRTIFYPHMKGGQPRDYGKINDIEVMDVYEKDGEIIHVTKENVVEDKVYLTIDWNNRFDHMQQHSGQHILSAAFYKLLNGQTASFHLGSEYVTIDINLSTLTDKDIEIVERFANQVIFSNFNIKTYIIGKTDITKFPLRKPPKVDNNIRIVEIENVDYSPCSGTHTRTTGEVGILKIRKYIKYKGMYRIEFVCGNRALKDYVKKNKQIYKISSLLSVNENNCFEGVNRLYKENIALNSKIKELNDELINYRVEAILEDSNKIKGVNYIVKLFEGVDFKTVRNITNSLINNNKNLVVLFGVINNNKTQFIFARTDDLYINMKDVFDNNIRTIDGNGGGNNKIVQGGCSLDKESLERFINRCLEYILCIKAK